MDQLAAAALRAGGRAAGDLRSDHLRHFFRAAAREALVEPCILIFRGDDSFVRIEKEMEKLSHGLRRLRATSLPCWSDPPFESPEVQLAVEAAQLGRLEEAPSDVAYEGVGVEDLERTSLGKPPHDVGETPSFAYSSIS